MERLLRCASLVAAGALALGLTAAADAPGVSSAEVRGAPAPGRAAAPEGAAPDLTGSWTGRLAGSDVRMEIRREGGDLVGEACAWRGMTGTEREFLKQPAPMPDGFAARVRSPHPALCRYSRFSIRRDGGEFVFREEALLGHTEALTRGPEGPWGYRRAVLSPGQGSEGAYETAFFDAQARAWRPEARSPSVLFAGGPALGPFRLRWTPPGRLSGDGTAFARLRRADIKEPSVPFGLPQGRTVSLACLDGGTYHYTCYVPRGYRHGVPTPVLINMSPRGEGKPLSPKMAEELGWIMAGLTEAKDGPWAPVTGNQEAVLWDLKRRFSVHPRRVYFSGLSGGGRASLSAAFGLPDECAGVLAIGAGSILGISTVNGVPYAGPMPRAPIPICFLSGETDYNRREMEAAYQREKRKGRPTAILYHPGGHTWGRPQDIEKALRWLARQKRAQLSGEGGTLATHPTARSPATRRLRR